MTTTPTVSIRFNKDQLQLVLDALTTRPYGEVAPLISHIAAQLEGRAEEPPASDTPPPKPRARKSA